MHILRSFFSAGRRRPHRSQPCRLRLEPLDERAMPSGFRQINLAADEPGVAQIQDPSLVNAWEIALNQGGGAIWVSSHGAGVSALYLGDVNGSAFVRAALTVTIPDGSPTGQVFNASTDFVITNGTQSARSLFIFAGETGSITGWNPAVPPATQANIAVDSNGAARYTGLAIQSVADGDRLYAADLANGEIDVFDAAFAPVSLAAGAFTDPKLPKGFAPFNIQNLGGTLYVTYARADKGPDIDDLKGGVVSAFDFDGNFLRRIATQGHLDAPWGLALAPADFGNFGGALLVGNHGDGRINAYDPATGQFLGRLREEGHGRPIRIDGLFGLSFGNGVSFGDRNALYFAAGPNDGTDGLFGSLRFVPDVAPSGASGARMPTISGEGPGSPSGKMTNTRLLPATGAGIAALRLRAALPAPIIVVPPQAVATTPTPTQVEAPILIPLEFGL
jgi:uncharacterized protein (TIGR03118 family)